VDLQERVTALEQRLNDLEAMEGIRETMSRYARAIDYAQYDELEAILTGDFIYQPGPWWPDQKGKENALNIFRNYRNTYQFPHRYIVNERIQVDGNTGTCFSYWLVVQSYGGQSYIGWGTYDLAFRLEDGIWKLAKMVIDIQTMTSLEKGWGMEQDRVASFPPRP